VQEAPEAVTPLEHVELYAWLPPTLPPSAVHGSPAHVGDVVESQLVAVHACVAEPEKPAVVQVRVQVAPEDVVPPEHDDENAWSPAPPPAIAVQGSEPHVGALVASHDEAVHACVTEPEKPAVAHVSVQEPPEAVLDPEQSEVNAWPPAPPAGIAAHESGVHVGAAVASHDEAVHACVAVPDHPAVEHVRAQEAPDAVLPPEQAEVKLWSPAPPAAIAPHASAVHVGDVVASQLVAVHACVWLPDHPAVEHVRVQEAPEAVVPPEHEEVKLWSPTPPAAIAVHGSAPHVGGTLASQLVAAHARVTEPENPAAVHVSVHEPPEAVVAPAHAEEYA
jgi:hypothetical protein